jgi:hypothetical protein
MECLTELRLCFVPDFSNGSAMKYESNKVEEKGDT